MVARFFSHDSVSEKHTAARPQRALVRTCGFFLACLLAGVFLLLGSACSSDSGSDFRAEGRKLMAEGNANGAVILFKNALEKDQTNFETRLDLGRAYMQLGKPQQADPEFQKCLRQRPDDPALHFELARLALIMNEPQKVLEFLDKAEKNMAPTAESRELRGLAQAMLENFEAAQAAYEQALALEPKRESASLGLARAHLALRDPAKALAIVDGLLAGNPQSADVLSLRAELAVRAGDIPKAIECRQTLAKSNPNDQGSRYMLAVLLLEQGRAAEAKAVRDAMRADFKDSAQVLMLDGLLAYEAGDFEGATAAFQASVAAAPTVEGYYRLGVALSRLDNYESALSALRRVLDVVPRHGQALHLTCTILTAQGRLDDALETAKRLTEYYPQNAMGHYLQGTVLTAMGNNKEALALLEKASELDPAMSEAALRRSSILLAEGKYQEARDGLAKAVEQNVDNIAARVALFSFYLGRRDFDEAMRVAEEGLQKQPDNAELLTMKASALAAQNKTDDALAVLERARTADPDLPSALTLEIRLHTQAGKIDKALAACEGFLERHPDNLERLVTSAALLDMAGRRDEATARLQKAYALGEQSVLTIMVQREVEAGRPEAAKKLLQDAYEAKPGRSLRDFYASFLLGAGDFEAAWTLYDAQEKVAPNEAALGKFRLLSAAGKHQEALEQAKRLQAADPSSVLGAVCTADALEHLGRIDEALDVLDKAYQATRKQPLLVAMAQVHMRQKNLDKAETFFRSARLADENSLEAVNGLAFIALSRKKYDDAVQLYEQALRLAPGNAEVCNNLAVACIESGREPERALQAATLAFAARPQNMNILDTMGHALLVNKRTSEAVEFLRRSVTMYPGSGLLQYRLGTALLQAGNRDEAGAALEKSVALGNFAAIEEAKTLLQKVKN